MSNIFIRNVVGSGTFAVPVDDTALANATVGLAGVLSGVAGLAVGRVLAWVETMGAGGATRVLNCLAEGFIYNGDVCPDAVETANLGSAISAAFLGTPGITSIGDQNISIFSVPAGSPVTLQVAYNNSIIGVPEIVVDAARGAVSIEDNATPIDAELFTVRSNGGSQNYICVNDERTQFWDNVHSQGSARYQGDAKAIVEGSVTYHDIAYEGAVAFNFQADWSFDAEGAGITGMEVNAQTHPRVTNSCTGPLIGMVSRAEHLASAKCDTTIGLWAEAGNYTGCGPCDMITAEEVRGIGRYRTISDLKGIHVQTETTECEINYCAGIMVEQCQYTGGSGRTHYNSGIIIGPMLNGKDANVALLVGHTTPPLGHFNIYSRSENPSAIMEWLGVGGDAPIANLDVNGSLALAEVHFNAKGSPYYIITTDQIFTVICDVTDGQVTVYLPPSSVSKGRVLCFKLYNGGVGINQMYIWGDHGELIDGKDHFNTSLNYVSVIIQCDGVQWWIIAHNA